MSSRSKSYALALALLLPLMPEPVAGQARWVPRLQLDNDVYNFWRRHTRRPDEEYTNGVRLALESAGGSWWGPRFAASLSDCAGDVAGPEGCRFTVLALGQELYTPNLDRAPYTVPDWEDERPFFAWLHLTGTARVVSERAQTSVSVSAGVTGPPAGGALAQSVAHRIGFNDPATGWETQIGFEPGVILEFRRAILAGSRGGRVGAGLDFAPEFAVSAGNIRSHAEAGGTVRVGWNMSHPWDVRTWKSRTPVEWWLSAGGRVSFVARDMSLDGTLRSPQRRVERVPVVARHEFGLGLRYRILTLEYRAATHTREYRTGPAHHTWSSMGAGISLAR